MKKEILLAVVVGLVFGLIITLGAYRARNSQFSPLTPTPIATPSPSSDLDTGSLLLHTPLDEEIVDNEKVTITGTTKPNVFVGIFINNNQTITTADASGNFSVEKTLEAGSNYIVVQTISEDGKTTNVERTVIFSTVDFELESVASQSASPTPAP